MPRLVLLEKSKAVCESIHFDSVTCACVCVSICSAAVNANAKLKVKTLLFKMYLKNVER